MMKLITRKLMTGIAAVFVMLCLFAPQVASAFSYKELQTVQNQSLVLCNTGDYDWACKYNKQYVKIQDAALKKPVDERNDYVVSHTSKELSTTAFLKVTSEYNKFVDGGKTLTPEQSSASATAASSDNCNNGGVKVSVDVNGTDNCVGGNGVNPIYAYLKGIIIFMGGAIGLAVVISIIVAGIQYSSSAGNAANITKAKERLTNTVIGLVLYLFLAAILRYLIPQIFT